MALEEDLARAAERAGGFAAPGERVEAVFAAEPAAGRRVYLCAFDGREARTWLLLDEAVPVTSRAVVRESVSLTALCEVIGEAEAKGEVLSAAEVVRRSEYAKRAHFARLAWASAKARAGSVHR